MIVVKLVHPPNTVASIYFGWPKKVAKVSEVQLRKALLLITEIPEWKENVEIEEHPEKTPILIVVTPEGTEVKATEVHPANASGCIEVKVVGSELSVNDVHP